MRRTKAERRKNDYKAIRRKRNIIKYAWRDKAWLEEFWGKQMHRLSKHSFSCTCPMCTQKSNRIGLPIRDKRKIDALNYEDNDE